MKKVFSLLLAVMIVLSLTVMISGCSPVKASVESVLDIDGDFRGHRSITIKYPLNTHIDALADTLVKSNPIIESKTSTFEYLGAQKDGYVFVMDIAFSSHADYVSQMSKLVGREVTSAMAQPDSVLASGTRMVEDFDVKDIISWIIKFSEDNEETKNLDYVFDFNKVNIGGKTLDTSSTIDINDRKGKPINSIVIETTNLKDGTYDRTITFSVPNKTYLDLAGSIEEYFDANTSDDAQYCDWTSQGSSWEYKVIYKGLDIEQLSQYTAMLLDVNEDEMFYGDKDNSSTPLSEGLVFEETFNTFSFIDEEGSSVPLEYRYALPTKTTHGDGAVLENGVWNTTGVWRDGVYSVERDTDTLDIRIPDGIQYSINGIRMELEVAGKDNFVRTTQFLYSKTQGMDGMLYAKDFFKAKGVTVTTDEDDENLICSVVCKGNTKAITDQLVKCFGSGNFMAYTAKDSKFSLSTKTEFTDYVNLTAMLNSNNSNRPITYTVFSSSSENIFDLKCGGADAIKSSVSENAYTIDVKGGEGTVVYNGAIPNTVNVIIYCVVGAVMLIATVATIVYMLYKQKKKLPSKDDDINSSAPAQTTTFSIAELTALSDKVNQKYREEIDEDINKKIEADRIETMSKELKAKEISKLEKMIYGSDDSNTSVDSTEDSDEDK